MAKTKKTKAGKETGNISVSTENIFPIIKKSLYSDHEIFLRELVSNGIDAIQKLKHLSTINEFKGETGDLKIKVAIDKEAGTLTISDNGIGMTSDEVKQYINQVAFSGAEEFVKKFKDAASNEDIIGKFGLGFYSSFMVASNVEILSLSWQEAATAIRWTCDGTTTYTLENGSRETRGTDVILHVDEDSQEFLESGRIRNILTRYCRFLPVEIEFEEEVINNTSPLWKKAPTDIKEEEYLEFFRELYPMTEDPLFWIHLNVDYPFNLTGILYFPKIKKDIDPSRNKIQLYSRQVFITDEVRNIVPEFLMLLFGVIDSPDIPLNVSRSYLQSDASVRKISDYITRKVGDKLKEIFRDDRSKFEEKWNDISVFVKYGMIADQKFYDKASEFCLLENTEHTFFTLDEYKTRISDKQTDKDGNLIYLYTTDVDRQDMFVQAAVEKGYDVLDLDGILDSHFIANMESKLEKSRWLRVDSDTVDKLISKSDEAPEESEEPLSDKQIDKVKEIFEKVRPESHMQVMVGKPGNGQMPVLITRPEFMRRMKEMSATGGMSYMGDLPESANIVVNAQHPLVQKLARAKSQEKMEQMARQLLDLALLSQNLLSGKDLTSFVKRTVEMLG